MSKEDLVTTTNTSNTSTNTIKDSNNKVEKVNIDNNNNISIKQQCQEELNISHNNTNIEVEQQVEKDEETTEQQVDELDESTIPDITTTTTTTILTSNNNSTEQQDYKLFNFSINITPKIHLPKNRSVTIENLQAKSSLHNRIRYTGKKTELLSHQYSKVKGGCSLNSSIKSSFTATPPTSQTPPGSNNNECLKFGGSKIFESLFSSRASCSKILRNTIRINPNNKRNKSNNNLECDIKWLEDNNNNGENNNGNGGNESINKGNTMITIEQDEDLESSSDEEKSYSKSLRERKTLEELEKGINRQLRDKIDQINLNKQFFENSMGGSRKKITLTKEQQAEQDFLETSFNSQPVTPKEFNVLDCTEGPYDLLYYTIHPLRGLDKRIDSTLTTNGKRKMTLEDKLKESGVDTPKFKLIEPYQPYNADISKKYFQLYKSGTLLSHPSHSSNLLNNHHHHHHHHYPQQVNFSNIAQQSQSHHQHVNNKSHQQAQQQQQQPISINTSNISTRRSLSGSNNNSLNNSPFTSPNANSKLNQSHNSTPIPLSSPLSSTTITTPIITLWKKVFKLFHPINWSPEEVMIFDEMIYVYGYDWTEISRILCGVKSPIQMYKFYLKQQQQQQKQQQQQQQLICIDNNEISEQQILISNHEKEFYNDWARICYVCFLENCCNKKVSFQKNLEKLRRDSINESFVECTSCKSVFHFECVDPQLNCQPLDNWYCSNECSSLAKLKCEICSKLNNIESMALCITCNKGYHIFCLKNPLLEVPYSDWDCETCQSMKSQTTTIHSILDELPKLERLSLPQLSDSTSSLSMVVVDHNSQQHQQQVQHQSSSSSALNTPTLPTIQEEQEVDQLLLQEQQSILLKSPLSPLSLSTDPPSSSTSTLSNTTTVNSTPPLTPRNNITTTTSTATPSSTTSQICIQSPNASALGSPSFFRRSINSPLFNSSTSLLNLSTSSTNNLSCSTSTLPTTTSSTQSLHSILHSPSCHINNHSNNNSNNNSVNNSNNTDDSGTGSGGNTGETNLSRIIAKEGSKLSSSSVPKQFITLKRLSDVCLGCLVSAGLFQDSPEINTTEVYQYVDTIQTEFTEEEFECESIFCRRLDTIYSSILFSTQSMIDAPILSNQHDTELQQYQIQLQVDSLKRQLRQHIKKQKQKQQKQQSKKPSTSKKRNQLQLLDKVDQPLMETTTPMITDNLIQQQHNQLVALIEEPTKVQLPPQKQQAMDVEVVSKLFSNETIGSDSNSQPITTTVITTPNKKRTFSESEETNSPISMVPLPLSLSSSTITTPPPLSLPIPLNITIPLPTITTPPPPIPIPAPAPVVVQQPPTPIVIESVPLPPPISEQDKIITNRERITISQFYDIVGEFILAPLVEEKPLKRYKRSKKYNTKNNRLYHQNVAAAAAASEEQLKLTSGTSADGQPSLPTPKLTSKISPLRAPQQQSAAPPIPTSTGVTFKIAPTTTTPSTSPTKQIQTISTLPPLSLPIPSLLTSLLSVSSSPQQQQQQQQQTTTTTTTTTSTPIVALLPSTSDMESGTTTKPSKSSRSSSKSSSRSSKSSSDVTKPAKVSKRKSKRATASPPPTPIVPSISGSDSTSSSSLIPQSPLLTTNYNTTTTNTTTTTTTNEPSLLLSLTNASSSIPIPTTATTSSSSLKLSSGNINKESIKDKSNVGVARGRRERMSTIESVHLSRWWIFSGNPKIKPELNSMAPNVEMDWVVRQHSDNIRKNDKIFIWICGKNAGIAATAHTLNDPERVILETCVEPTSYQSSKPNQHHTIRVKIDKILSSIIPKRFILENQELSNMTIIRAPLATNFWLNDDESKTLCDMIDSLEKGTLIMSTTIGTNTSNNNSNSNSNTSTPPMSPTLSTSTKGSRKHQVSASSATSDHDQEDINNVRFEDSNADIDMTTTTTTQPIKKISSRRRKKLKSIDDSSMIVDSAEQLQQQQEEVQELQDKRLVIVEQVEEKEEQVPPQQQQEEDVVLEEEEQVEEEEEIEEEESSEEEEVIKRNSNHRCCVECNKFDSKSNLITCDTCCSYYHSNCLSEPIDKSGFAYWICYRCCMTDKEILNCKLVIGWLEIKSKVKKLLFKKCDSFSFNLKKSLGSANKKKILSKFSTSSIQFGYYRNQLTRMVNQRFLAWYNSLVYNNNNQQQLNLIPTSSSSSTTDNIPTIDIPKLTKRSRRSTIN